ncbi:CD109 antigen-like [Polymixia lowei]
MDGIWILAVWTGLVCSALPGSTQNSSSLRPFYLISGPEDLRGGTPTLLAVTVLTDSPVGVTAQVMHGNTIIVTIPANSTIQSSVFTLEVRGYQRDKLIFTNTTVLGFNRRTVSTFIQTDRSLYRPGDTVRIRIVSDQSDHYPYEGRVEISVRDPRGNAVQRWDSSSSHLGIESKEFNLSQTPPLGQWAITTTVNGLTDEKVFIVENEEHPHFEVLVKTAPQVLVGDDITGTVRAESMGFKENTTVEVHVLQNTFQLAFHDFPRVLKPSLHFSTKLKISRYDRRPLSSLDLMNSVLVQVTQRRSNMDAEPTNMTLPVPEDGNVHIEFTLQNTVEMLFIQAKYMSSEETLTLYSNFSSPSGSYVQILSSSSLSAQVGLPLQLNVESSFQITEFHYVVSSRDQVVTAGTNTSPSSFSLIPTISWTPEAYITVYCVLPDGEVANDTVHIPIHDTTWTSPKVTVPHSITSWRAIALVMSENLGLGLTAVPPRLTVSQDMSLSLDVPPCLVRGEEIVLLVNVVNNLQRDMEVTLMVAQSEAYEFVLAEKWGFSVVNARKVTAGSQDTASALFPIRVLALGEMEITVNAVSAQYSETLVRTVLVKPEGVEQSFSETLFLELEPMKRNSSRTVSFSFPPDVVPGSQRVHVALVGDILALSINNLDSLVEIPHSCGEQNMIHFAPSVYVLQYLDKTTQDSKEIRTRALRYMMEGYQKELSYQRDDGSFSAFGASDTSGSIWLTAFVLRCFLQARPFMRVDQSVLSRAVGWLVGHQGSRGEFTEVGRVIHTELRGGMDNGPVALTAFVLMALLEDKTYADMFPGNVSLTIKYLESRVMSGGVVSNYSLCLAAYALAMTNSPEADTALAELSRRADNKDGVMMWRTSRGREADGFQPYSSQIEMSAYVLLAFYRRASVEKGIGLMKWLSRQRNHKGGYGTTQDTVVALQALAHYAAFSGADAIDLRINMSTSSSVSQFKINSTTYLMYQSQEVDAENDLVINVYLEGRGFALFQMNVLYNLKSGALSQSPQHDADHEAFSLDVKVYDDERDHDRMMLSICPRLLENQGISQTGMVMIDVGILSGFTLAPEAAVPVGIIRKVETSPGRASLYLDSLTTEDMCVVLTLIRSYRVARVRGGVVQVYDYYEPRRRATRTYKSDLMHNMDSCAFCGRDCNLCGTTITVSSTLSSYSISSATYSLGCLLVAVGFFILT